MKKLLIATALVALLSGCNQQQSSNEAVAVQQNSTTAAAPTATPPQAPLDRESARKVMHERHEGMEDIGKATKAVGKTLQSGSPDIAVIQKSASAIEADAKKSVDWFPAGTGPDVGKTGANPEIWQQPQEFAARMKDFQDKAAAFNTAAASGDINVVKTSFADLGKSCKACHDKFRKKMHANED